MAIETHCSCGRSLVLRDELAGKRIRCPRCAAAIEVLDRVEIVPTEGPPPLPTTAPMRDAPAHEDEDLVEVVAVDGPLAQPSIAPPPAEAEEAYAAAPPLPITAQAHRPVQRKRKKPSVYEEFYGDEPAAHGLYRESGFLQNCILGGILVLLIVGLGIGVWNGLGVWVIALAGSAVVVAVIWIFFGLPEWWY